MLLLFIPYRHYYKHILTTAGKRTCFILYSNESRNWNEAYDRCQEFKMSSLAIDDTEETHNILTTLLEESNITRAWLSGKPAPFYWNWAPPLPGECKNKMSKYKGWISYNIYIYIGKVKKVLLIFKQVNPGYIKRFVSYFLCFCCFYNIFSKIISWICG